MTREEEKVVNAWLEADPTRAAHANVDEPSNLDIKEDIIMSMEEVQEIILDALIRGSMDSYDMDTHARNGWTERNSILEWLWDPK
eukprot:9362510-Heterocapsa_arctica.AAC.1